MDLVKFLMWAAWVAARRRLNPVAHDCFKAAPLEFVSKESIDLVLEKVAFWLKLESRVEELLPRINSGPWQGTILLLLYAGFFGGPFPKAWSSATFVIERNDATQSRQTTRVCFGELGQTHCR